MRPVPLFWKNFFHGPSGLIRTFFLVLLLAACESKTPVKTPPVIEVDDYFNSLFERNGDGFTGGDGTYSVLLPDGRTVWIFGDTFLGTVNPDMSREKTDPMFIRNSFVVQDGNKMTTLHRGKTDEFKSMMIPRAVTDSGIQISEEEIWYWPGDGFIENNMLKVFASEFHQVDTGMWGFEWQGMALLSYSLPDLKASEIVEFPRDKTGDIHFGHCVYEGDDFTYLYGLWDSKAYVARAEKGNAEGEWQFFAGDDQWSEDVEDAVPMSDINGSEQFSVVKHEDKYIWVTQLGGFSKEICSLISSTPFGPWGKKKTIYTTPVPFENENLFTYNAVAHPQFTDNGKMLISYNTNSFVLADHFVNAAIYRPRFIRVPLEFIF